MKYSNKKIEDKMTVGLFLHGRSENWLMSIPGFTKIYK